MSFLSCLNNSALPGPCDCESESTIRASRQEMHSCHSFPVGPGDKSSNVSRYMSSACELGITSTPALPPSCAESWQSHQPWRPCFSVLPAWGLPAQDTACISCVACMSSLSIQAPRQAVYPAMATGGSSYQRPAWADLVTAKDIRAYAGM